LQLDAIRERGDFIKNLISLANRRTLEKERYLLVELMKRINKNGLRCPSWGTPDEISISQRKHHDL